MKSDRRILVCTNAAWNLYNFRRPLMDALAASGCEVHGAAPADEYASRIGYPFHPLPMSARGTNPIADVLLIRRMMRLYGAVDPDVILHFTPKPNIYGAIAAARLRIPSISNVAGLGAVFIGRSPLALIVRLLYRFSQPRASFVFFQNRDDLDLFVSRGWAKPQACQRIPGSGVDVTVFQPRPGQSEPFRFLLMGRLLWDKGVGEYIQAARQLKARYPHVEFQLLGDPNYPNPSSVGAAQVAKWQSEGIITYLGVSDDVREAIAAAGCIVLPSYREGLPRSLLEAMAMERPIITTDAIGCRDVVEDGVNGFVCPVGDASRLAEVMERMIRLSPEERSKMGRAGRSKATREFSVEHVIQAYQQVISNLLSDRA